MKKLLLVFIFASSPVLAQNNAAKEPVCEPIGRTSKGDLVYSMECRNIPGLAPGTNGYNPLPPVNIITAPKPAAVPESK
jgi:hypothetical protein